MHLTDTEPIVLYFDEKNKNKKEEYYQKRQNEKFVTT